jgi:hypothetical protein
MQTEENQIRLTYKRRWWRLGGRSMNSALMPGAKKIPSYIPIANTIAKRMAKKIDGQALSAWPEVLFDVPTTAHILGGAVMAETPDKGVVDFKGEIHGYPNLYVVDGSNVPVNLGVNPSFTTTAMAEYIMSQMPKKTDGEKSLLCCVSSLDLSFAFLSFLMFFTAQGTTLAIEGIFSKRAPMKVHIGQLSVGKSAILKMSR